VILESEGRRAKNASRRSVACTEFVMNHFFMLARGCVRWGALSGPMSGRRQSHVNVTVATFGAVSSLTIQMRLRRELQ
jgi:hypothetical protein